MLVTSSSRVVALMFCSVRSSRVVFLMLLIFPVVLKLTLSDKLLNVMHRVLYSSSSMVLWVLNTSSSSVMLLLTVSSYSVLAMFLFLVRDSSLVLTMLCRLCRILLSRLNSMFLNQTI